MVSPRTYGRPAFEPHRTEMSDDLLCSSWICIVCGESRKARKRPPYSVCIGSLLRYGCRRRAMSTADERQRRDDNPSFQAEPISGRSIHVEHGHTPPPHPRQGIVRTRYFELYIVHQPSESMPTADGRFGRSVFRSSSGKIYPILPQNST